MPCSQVSTIDRALESHWGSSRRATLSRLVFMMLLIGATIVVVQLYLEVKAGYLAMSDLASGERMKLRYLGSVIAGVGAALEVIAVVATRPWAKRR